MVLSGVSSGKHVSDICYSPDVEGCLRAAYYKFGT